MTIKSNPDTPVHWNARAGHNTRNIIWTVTAMTLLAAGFAYFFWTSGNNKQAPVPQQVNCINNLKQVGLAFRMWALDHDDQYPFNVSTNASGSRELSSPGHDGFDANPAPFLRCMSNELASTLVLVCPQDHGRKPAPNFATLQLSNVTYHFRSGPSINDTNTTEILAVCPVDGHILYCDGRVK